MSKYDIDWAKEILSLGKQKGNKKLKGTLRGKQREAVYDKLASILIEDLKSRGVGSDDKTLIALTSRTWSDESKDKYVRDDVDVDLTDYDILRMYVDYYNNNRSLQDIDKIVKQAKSRKSRFESAKWKEYDSYNWKDDLF